MEIAALCSHAVNHNQQAPLSTKPSSTAGGGAVEVAAAVRRRVRVKMRSEGGRAVGGTVRQGEK